MDRVRVMVRVNVRVSVSVSVRITITSRARVVVRVRASWPSAVKSPSRSPREESERASVSSRVAV